MKSREEYFVWIISPGVAVRINGESKQSNSLIITIQFCRLLASKVILRMLKPGSLAKEPVIFNNFLVTSYLLISILEVTFLDWVNVITSILSIKPSIMFILILIIHFNWRRKQSEGKGRSMLFLTPCEKLLIVRGLEPCFRGDYTTLLHQKLKDWGDGSFSKVQASMRIWVQSPESIEKVKHGSTYLKYQFGVGRGREISGASSLNIQPIQ